MPDARSHHKEQPIRIVRKKKGHAGHHGGAWKVAYADFVTAMMALFIVLWIIGQSKQIREYVANYFKDPGAFFENTSGGRALQSEHTMTSETPVDEFLKRQKERLEDVASKITDALKKEPALRGLMDQVKMEIVKEGLRIELLEGSHSFFFDIGSAQLNPQAIEILTLIAQQVGKLPNTIIIEGHTDSRQYARADGYTNFELSADRANSARKILMTHGLHEKQVVEVRGYADTQLRNREDPFDVSNRRTSIIIKYEQQETHGQADANSDR
ncbi:MAG TPA: flagellar motor protein MotB [Bacteroidota bacterium]|nr:flagellar motor protein MotB [Bacteroidota bacterium]